MALGLWDIAQFALPLAAGAVGTPAAGAGVAALLAGLEEGTQGGDFKEILKKAAVGGGTSMLGAGAGEALGGVLSKGATEGVGTVLADEGAGTVLKAGEKLGDAAAKQRFAEHLLELGDAGMSKWAEEQKKKQELTDAASMINQQAMSNRPGGFTAPEPWIPGYRRY